MKSLYAHQTYAIEMMDTVNRLAVWYPCGLGKTAIALTWICNALKDGRISNALVICPASLVPNWEADIPGMSEFEHMSEDDVQLLKDNVTVVSYHKLYKHIGKQVALREEVDRVWDCIICDESHNLGSFKSIQTQACLLLAADAKYRYIMSGTPISGSTRSGGKDYKKLYGQIQFLNPGLWNSWTEWTRKYVLAKNQFFQPILYRDAELNRLMEEYGITVDPKECIDLPEETVIKQNCHLVEKTVYYDIKNNNLSKYNITPRDAGVSFTKLLQICSGSLITDDRLIKMKTSKDAVLAELLNDTNEKIVIFCNYTASIDRCAAIARKTGCNPVIFDGRSRGPTWKQFTEGNADVLICQYQSGGTGLNFQAASHIMILYEPCLSSVTMAQAKARIRRAGQTEPCIYYVLSTPSTAEATAWTSVLNGVSVNTQMIENWFRTGHISD